MQTGGTRGTAGATGGEHMFEYNFMSYPVKGNYSSGGMATLGSRKMSSSRDKDVSQLPDSSRSPSRHQKVAK